MDLDKEMEKDISPDLLEQVKEYLSKFNNSIEFIRHKLWNDIEPKLRSELKFLQIMEEDNIMSKLI